jgi:hypothetical protein
MATYDNMRLISFPQSARLGRTGVEKVGAGHPHFELNYLMAPAAKR